MDNGTKLQHIEAPRVVSVSAETIDAIVTTDTLGSLEEGIIIGDLYGSCHSVARVQEAVTSSGGTDACMESSSCDVGDLGVTVESVDVGSCSSVIDSRPDIDSCVQSQVTTIETLLAGSMDTFGDFLDDAMICTGYDTLCQILSDDSDEGLDESQD